MQEVSLAVVIMLLYLMIVGIVMRESLKNRKINVFILVVVILDDFK